MERRVAPSCLRVRQPRTVYADDDLEGCTERGLAKSCDAISCHTRDRESADWLDCWRPALGFIQSSDDPRAGSTSAIP